MPNVDVAVIPGVMMPRSIETNMRNDRTLCNTIHPAKRRCLVDNPAERIGFALHGRLDVLHFFGGRNVRTLQDHLSYADKRK